ncbi:CD59 glycoprotein [Brachyhypopomus gauderio]|uniref:CD59 glycoprotein n=1 Tax=Brachyhypopomus gauderio TaxID=698409 RepID=UPI004041FE5F
MKVFVGVCLVFGLSLLGLGSAIKCFKCKDYTGSCSKTQDCRFEDACLSLHERGGLTYRQCIKYSDCEKSMLTQMFPHISSFKYSCCMSDLCNHAPLTVARSSLLGLLASLAVFLWCVL